MSPRTIIFPELHDAAWLTHEYATLERTTTDIAHELGCSTSAVVHALEKLGIARRGRFAGGWKPQWCERCGKEYMPAGGGQRFCSAACRAGTGACKNCGGTFVQPVGRHRDVGRKIFCTERCWREWQRANRLYRTTNQGDYIRVLVPRGTPSADRTGRMLEHRWIMQEHLGRPLLPSETVHHRNGDKTDNRLENLQLRSGPHGNGQAWCCADCGSTRLVPAAV